MFFAGIRSFLERPSSVATLNGHLGPVITIDISPKGNLLASGGADSVKIWDLKTMTEIYIPQQPTYERAHISCVRWITRKNETLDTLVYGNALGFLVFLQHRPTEGRFEFVHSTRIARGGEILSITSDVGGGSSTRIATGTRDKCVQVWMFNGIKRSLQPVHSKAYGDDKDIVPKALAFDSNANLYVFGLYDGGLYKYGGHNAERLEKYQFGSPVGNAAVDVARKICVIDNVGIGFDLYRLDTGNFVKNFTTGEPSKTYPRGVAFANDSQVVVGGSDHGKVYIFDRKLGTVITTLTHAKLGGVETLAVHDKEDGSVILATASSTASGPSCIRVWKWLPNKKVDKIKQQEDERWAFGRGIDLLLRIGVIFATLAYFMGVIRDWQFDNPWPKPLDRVITKSSIQNENDIRELIRQMLLEEINTAQKDERKEGHGANFGKWKQVGHD